MLKNGPLKFAIAGCGNIAQRHAEHINNTGMLQAVCDVLPEKAAQLAAKYNCASYHSLEAMLAAETTLDVVCICTPNGLHAQHSIQSLQAGFHVLCEKPMAIHHKDGQAMIQAAQINNRQLFIVKQNRFNPPVAAVKEAISKGILGKIYSVQLNCFWNRNEAYYHNSWRGTQALDGGTLYTQFSHFIDLLYWLFGDIKSVQAVMGNLAHRGVIAFEDTGLVTFEFLNGTIGGMHYTVNSYEKNMEGSLTIIAEKGSVKIGGQYLNKLDYQCIENYEFKSLPAGNAANDYGSYAGSMSNHDKVYQNLHDVLQHGADMYASAYDGLKTVEIIEKIYQAARAKP